MSRDPAPGETALAIQAVAEAGRFLLNLRAGWQGDPSALMVQADREANRLIIDRLRAARPMDAILSEETPDDAARLTHERVWIVDPLDGTREYGEGRADWAVHVALSVGGDPRAAAVALPARSLTLSTVVAPTLSRVRQARPRIVTSRTRPCPAAEHLARRLGGDIMPMGSAGAKAMAVVLGEAEIYVHDSGLHEWDSCAPVAVALSAGLHASRLDGSALVFNAPRPVTPDLLIARPEWAVRALESLGQSNFQSAGFG